MNKASPNPPPVEGAFFVLRGTLVMLRGTWRMLRDMVFRKEGHKDCVIAALWPSTCKLICFVLSCLCVQLTTTRYLFFKKEKKQRKTIILLGLSLFLEECSVLNLTAAVRPLWWRWEWPPAWAVPALLPLRPERCWGWCYCSASASRQDPAGCV